MITHELFINQHKLVALELPTSKPQGTPIILLHGVTLSIGVWAIDETFGNFGPCYALSLPGHYPAIAPKTFNEADLAPAQLAYLLSQAIKTLVGEQPVIVAGHSTGGFAALTLALYYPDMVKGVISLAGFAQGQWLGIYGLMQRLVTKNSRWLQKLAQFMFKISLIHPEIYLQFWRAVAYDWAAMFSYPHLKTLLTHVYPNAKQLDLQAIVTYFRAMAYTNIIPQLHQIRAPLLAVAGDKDGVVPMTQAVLMARHAPHGELVLIPEVGHMLFVESPRIYDHVLQDWLSKLE